jgi:UDP-GlcNAc:undecaprenyl-phosphate GlcNAc-1-phosphate transferase
VTSLSAWDYLLVFSSCLLGTLALTPLALRLAHRRQFLDHPGEIKAQASPIPYLGGAAIVTAFAVVILGAALFRSRPDGVEELAVILGGAVVLAVLGLVDDLRGLSPWLRLGVEAVAAAAVWASDTRVVLTGEGFVDAVITIVWIVGVTNAFNLLDNMDGLSAGVAAIASFFVFAMAADNGQFLVAVFGVAVAGCALGFLRSNFHPATIYMGDAGSLFLGFLIGVLAMKLSFSGPRSVTFAVPIVVLGVPLFDTVLVTINRLRHGRNPLSGGRDHTSHRLVFVGLSVPVAVTLIYAAAVSLGVLGMVLARSDRGTGLLLLAWIAVVGVLFGTLLSAVPVYATSRRRHLMLQEVARAEQQAPEVEDGAA